MQFGKARMDLGWAGSKHPLRIPYIASAIGGYGKPKKAELMVVFTNVVRSLKPIYTSGYS